MPLSPALPHSFWKFKSSVSRVDDYFQNINSLQTASHSNHPEWPIDLKIKHLIPRRTVDTLKQEVASSSVHFGEPHQNQGIPHLLAELTGPTEYQPQYPFLPLEYHASYARQSSNGMFCRHSPADHLENQQLEEYQPLNAYAASSSKSGVRLCVFPRPNRLARPSSHVPLDLSISSTNV